VSLTYEDVQEILRIIDQASTKEIHIEVDDFKLIVRKQGADGAPVVTTSASPAPAPATKPAAAPAAPTAAPAAASPTDAAPSATAVALKSPLSGTFYRAPAPGADPFVSEGSKVKSGDTVCILDVMKVMNTLKAPCNGKVAKIAVENAESVSAGQALIWFEPA
jgi:acetyl-CoA carboxylase biotin carboxyl carrier protein